MLLSVLKRNLPIFTSSISNLTKTHQNCFFTLSKTSETVDFTTHNLNQLIKRYKSKKKTVQNVRSGSETDEETESDPEIQDRHTKIVRANLNSLRMDSVLKTGMGMARNKVEALFYESKIRLNGEKVLKKSKNVDVGDEIDIIKGVDINNPDFLIVARVEVLQVQPAESGVRVKLRRSKSLTIENYKDEWKGGPETP